MLTYIPIVNQNVKTIACKRISLHNLSGKPVLVLCHPHRRNASWCLYGTYCLLSWPWVPLKEAWLHIFCIGLSGMHIAEIPRASSSPGWRMPTTSAFPHRRDASVHSWQYSQLSLNRNQFFQKVYLENDEYWYNINPWIEQTVQMQIKTEKKHQFIPKIEFCSLVLQ